MAERRMFAKTIIDSDAFLDMPLSAQSLYFHLAMRADDDGFVNNPRKIQRMVGASEDDCKLLLLKRFILSFDTGIIVIKHWKIHNLIQKDRYKPTVYLEEKSSLTLDKNNAYTECIQDVSKMETQVSIGKDSIDKVSIEESQQVGTPSSSKRFVKPTIEEIKEYCRERKNRIDAENFYNFYESKGWKVGNQPMKNWKSCIITWEKREKQEFKKSGGCENARGNQFSAEELNSCFTNIFEADI